MKKQIEDLIKNLKKDTEYFRVFTHEELDDDFWFYYYSITGWYNDSYFHIGFRKTRDNKIYNEIFNTTNKLSDFKKYLKSKTKLKFTIS